MPDFEKLSYDQETALAALFEDARTHEEPPSAELLARVVADAGALVPPQPQVTPQTSRWSGFRDLLSQFGGLPGASVMTACALFGVAFGYAGPESVLNLTGLAEISEMSDLDAEMDMFETADFSFDEGELLQ